MIVFLILLTVPNRGTSTPPKSATKIYKYQTLTFPRPLEISDDQLIIKDLSTFVHNNSLYHSDHGSYTDHKNYTGTEIKTPLRMRPVYKEKFHPKEYYPKLFELMKQSLYATQDRLKHLQVILNKYDNDIGFRAGYIFTKLDQILDDMRRIYSFTVKQFRSKSIYYNIIFFRHLAKKNIDVSYIVDFLFSFHEQNMKKLQKIYSEFENV